MTIVNLRVSNPDGQQSNLFGFDVTVPPSASPNIVSIFPARAIVGETITLNGGNFATGAVVKFGTVLGVDVVVNSATQISVKVPQISAGSVSVSVQNTSGLISNSVNLTVDATPAPAPTTTQFTPTSGVPGSTLTIVGTGFVVGARVRFSTILGTNVAVASATQLTVAVPSMTPGVVNVVVENPDGGVSIGRSFTVVAPPPPNITSINPASGPPGTVVEITGTGFTSGASAMFGSNPGTNVTVVSPTRITVTVPSSLMGSTTLSIRTSTGSASVYFDITVPVVNPLCRVIGDQIECWNTDADAWVLWSDPSPRPSETAEDVLIEMIDILNTTVTAQAKALSLLQSQVTAQESKQLNLDLALAILRSHQGNIDLLMR